ncbi:MAG: hypothetical protein V3V75_06360 [Thermoguttaceae bacterium]
MKRASLWFAVLAILTLLSMPAFAVDDYDQESACTLEVCPITGMMMLKCPDTGRTFYAAPALVKLMIKSTDTGEMEQCSFEGNDIFLCVESGQLMRMTPSGEVTACKAAGKSLFLCPKTGMILAGDSSTGEKIQFEEGGKMLNICPKSGKCMLIEAEVLEDWKGSQNPDT